MSNRSINFDNFGVVFHWFKDFRIISTAEYEFARICVTVHDPFYQVLNVLRCFVNVIEDYHWKQEEGTILTSKEWVKPSREIVHTFKNRPLYFELTLLISGVTANSLLISLTEPINAYLAFASKFTLSSTWWGLDVNGTTTCMGLLSCWYVTWAQALNLLGNL